MVHEHGVEDADRNHLMAEDPATAHLAVDVASWADEEGHWGQMFGSRSFIGRLEDSQIDASRHREEGTPMREARYIRRLAKVRALLATAGINLDGQLAAMDARLATLKSSPV